MSGQVRSRPFVLASSPLVVLALAAGLAIVAGCRQPRPDGGPQRGGGGQASTAPHASTENLMRGVVWQHYEELLLGLSTVPDAARSWEDLETHAAVLCESSHVLLHHASTATTPEGVWEHAAGRLGEGGSATLSAIQQHDLRAARSGFEVMNSACSSCHLECSAAYPLPWHQP